MLQEKILEPSLFPSKFSLFYRDSLRASSLLILKDIVSNQIKQNSSNL